MLLPRGNEATDGRAKSGHWSSAGATHDRRGSGPNCASFRTATPLPRSPLSAQSPHHPPHSHTSDLDHQRHLPAAPPSKRSSTIASNATTIVSIFRSLTRNTVFGKDELAF
uniref:Uncharacterized protein n=1 Tax=Plectus sambesii TaxID=2011161 RepID=A0A914X185_9BILA